MSLLRRSAVLAAAIVTIAFAQTDGVGAQAAGDPIGLVRYAALGDSVTWQNYYVATYSNHVETDLNTEVAATNLGTPAWLSGALLNALRNNQTYRDAVAEADLITIFIGLNDFQWVRSHYLDPNSTVCPPPKDTCMPAMVAAFQSNWAQILAEIDALNPAANTAVRTLTIYNPYVAQDQASGNFAYLNGFLDQMNATILASPDVGIPVADLHSVFNGASGTVDATAAGYFTAPDVLHPNAAGHTAMAGLLRGIGYIELDANDDGVLDIETDSDGDGCADVEELSEEAVSGGLRDPANPWDFYDVNATQIVDGQDIGLVRLNFNPQGPLPAEDQILDRSLGSAPWAPGAADGRINAIDIALVRASFNHNCQLPS
jgi:lysophospholipase L1-like esterase